MPRKSLRRCKSGRRSRSLGKGTETPLATLRSSVDDLPVSPVYVRIVDDQPGVTQKQWMVKTLVRGKDKDSVWLSENVVVTGELKCVTMHNNLPSRALTLRGWERGNTVSLNLSAKS